ncbi:fluoroquinolone transport system permease protein [Stackebrandtia endophytica]|uniref:Fluoroquinolone transport system permease protein n=1 Tax=Stackebrandtia endophytica TaxID=1496996 RepID=A0A543AW17_9ACTN|nr:fluoroquinolone transporter permease [Stackebrandtia endophytica]TQL76783.1 fluoroquinolone transport system permease protein [Stackebrandtia endophytica]
MTRLLAGIRLDIRLQWRYGFHYAALFSIILWEVPIFLLPDHLLPTSMPYLIFGDLALVGFFFIVGAVFFERGERTLFANLVTPMRFGDYLGAKLSTLTLLSLGLSLVIVISGVGFDVSMVPLLVSALLCSLLFLLAGFISAAPFQSVSDWFIPSTAVIALLNIPLLDYSGLWQHPIMYLIPTHGSLLMMGAAFGQLDPTGWQWEYAVGYQLLWVVLLIVIAKRAFTRFIIQREGSA